MHGPEIIQLKLDEILNQMEQKIDSYLMASVGGKTLEKNYLTVSLTEWEVPLAKALVHKYEAKGWNKVEINISKLNGINVCFHFNPNHYHIGDLPPAETEERNRRINI